MTASLRPVARLPSAASTGDGIEVLEGVLESAEARIAVLSWGASLRDWRAGRERRPVTLGFADVAAYPPHSPAFGAICGRVANRVSNARFRLGGREVRLIADHGPHCLHGGPLGLGVMPWRMEVDAAGSALRLTRVSPDGEGGWPGRVAFEVTMRLSGPRLRFEMTALPDRPTPIALAQHSYWNLDGSGDVAGHRLWLAASRHAEVSADLIPTGRLAPVAGTPVDFRAGRDLRGPDGGPLALDLPLALDAGRDPAAPAAELIGARGDMRLRLWTDQPSVQVYTGGNLRPDAPGLDGRRHAPFSGVCLEAQNFPDAVNRPEFPDPVFSPDRPYRQVTEVEIAPLAPAPR